MESLLTPSARARENLKPYQFTLGVNRAELPLWVYWIKVVSGLPVRFLLLFFLMVPFLSGESGLIAVMAINLLTLVYLVADRFTTRKEFTWFRSGFDIPLLLYCLFLFYELLRHETSGGPRLDLMGFVWISSVYFVGYAFDLFPGLNRVMNLVFVLCLLTAAALNMEGWMPYLVDSSLEKRETLFPFSFVDRDTAVTLLTVLLPISISAISLTKKSMSYGKWAMLVLSCALGLAYSALTLRIDVVLALTASTVVILFYAHRWLMLVATLVFAAGFFLLPEATTAWKDVNSDERRSHLKEDLAMFSESPWIGVGLSEYHKRFPSEELPSHNNYFQILASQGLVGLSLHLFLILTLLTFTHRLWNDIPQTHFWHRVLALGLIGSQVSVYMLGLFHWTWNDPSLLATTGYLGGLLCYLGEGYGRGLVSDDYCL